LTAKSLGVGIAGAHRAAETMRRSAVSAREFDQVRRRPGR
jgi:hypothetical protein